jgi:hypothetical protein
MARNVHEFAVSNVTARAFMRGDDGSVEELPRDYVLAACRRVLSFRGADGSARVVVWCTGRNRSVFSIVRRVCHEWRHWPPRLPNWFARVDDLVVDAAQGRISLRVRGMLSADLDRIEFQCTAPNHADALRQIERLWAGRDCP